MMIKLNDHLSVRQATLADVDLVATLAIESFVAKFGHLYPPEDLLTFLRMAYGQDAMAQSIEKPGNTTWILYDGEQPAGHALTGFVGLPHADVKPGDGELKRLYVHPAETGKGMGRVFMDFILKDLLKEGPRTLWLGVYSENLGAQAFYARYGFEMAGEYEFPVGETRDREFIYRRTAQSA